MGLKLGCIADDFTGATDLANNLVRTGWRVLQVMGVPVAGSPLALDDGDAVDAVVVALKTRTVPAQQAVQESLAALEWLLGKGATQIYFKVCSTFDSTAQGNIGPVTEALADALQAPLVLVTPAFPDNGRTVFKGHLFVGDTPLHESSMRQHPLTPMTDSNLVRVLQAQSRRRVGLIEQRVVAQGPEAIGQRATELQRDGCGLAIVDAISNLDLMHMGAALAQSRLVTAGSGVAIGLGGNFGLVANSLAAQLPAAQGYRAAISGSCSAATLQQVEHFRSTGASCWALDPMRLEAPQALLEEALAWAGERLALGPVLLYSSADAAQVHAVQQRWGVEGAGARIEAFWADVATGLVASGVRQLVVAGGETSGACCAALGIRQLRIGPQIDTGVPWCHAPAEAGRPALHVALKSGNFGAEEFFLRAFALLQA